MAIYWYFKSALQASKNAFLFSVMFQQIKICIAQESAIDPEHLKEYPYCGELKLPEASVAANRAVNGNVPKNDYRWAVLVKRYINPGKDGKSLDVCSGSVITDR